MLDLNAVNLAWKAVIEPSTVSTTDVLRTFFSKSSVSEASALTPDGVYDAYHKSSLSDVGDSILLGG